MSGQPRAPRNSFGRFRPRGTAVAIQADSADPAAIQHAVDETVRALGGLDILVNNAAIGRYNNIADFAVEDLDALLAVNVRGPVLASKAAIPHLKEGGRIINIGSAGADRIVGVPGTVYYMTKSALQAFNRGLARELGARDITVNLVQPGRRTPIRIPRRENQRTTSAA